MILSFSYLDDVKHIKMVSAVSTYGIGFLTYIVFGFCQLFGVECKMYDDKIEKAKLSATAKMIEKAKLTGADGIMNVKIQMHGTTILMYGIAFKAN